MVPPLHLLAMLGERHLLRGLRKLHEGRKLQFEIERVDCENHETIVGFLSRRGTTRALRYALCFGANPDGGVTHGGLVGRSPLMQATSSDKVELLLRFGAEAGRVDIHGVNALHMHAFKLRVAAVRLLLKAGVNPSSLDARGSNPLYCAVVGMMPYLPETSDELAVVDALLAAGSTVNAVDEKGQTALSWAASIEKEEVVRRLLRAGADPTVGECPYAEGGYTQNVIAGLLMLFGVAQRDDVAVDHKDDPVLLALRHGAKWRDIEWSILHRNVVVTSLTAAEETLGKVPQKLLEVRRSWHSTSLPPLLLGQRCTSLCLVLQLCLRRRELSYDVRRYLVGACLLIEI